MFKLVLMPLRSTEYDNVLIYKEDQPIVVIDVELFYPSEAYHRLRKGEQLEVEVSWNIVEDREREDTFKSDFREQMVRY